MVIAHSHRLTRDKVQNVALFVNIMAKSPLTCFTLVVSSPLIKFPDRSVNLSDCQHWSRTQTSVSVKVFLWYEPQWEYGTLHDGLRRRGELNCLKVPAAESMRKAMITHRKVGRARHCERSLQLLPVCVCPPLGGRASGCDVGRWNLCKRRILFLGSLRLKANVLCNPVCVSGRGAFPCSAVWSRNLKEVCSLRTSWWLFQVLHKGGTSPCCTMSNDKLAWGIPTALSGPYVSVHLFQEYGFFLLLLLS